MRWWVAAGFSSCWPSLSLSLSEDARSAQFRKENGQFFLSCCWCGCDGGQQFAHAPTTSHRRKLLLENNGGASTTDAASRCSRSLHLSRFRLWKRQTEIDSSFLSSRGKKTGTTTMETTEDVEKRFERAMERLFPGSPPTPSARCLFFSFHSYYYSAFWFRGLSQFLSRSKALVPCDWCFCFFIVCLWL